MTKLESLDTEFSIEQLEFALLRKKANAELERENEEEKEVKVDVEQIVSTPKVKVRKKVFHNSSVMNYLVITCILSILIYVGIALFFYYAKGTPPADEITRLFFAFFGGELLAMAGITISKHRIPVEEVIEEVDLY